MNSQIAIKYVKQITSQIFQQIKGPRWGTLFITRKCNFKCIYCGVAQYKSDDIDTATWFKIIDKMKEFGIVVVNIVGGEPLLRQDIFEIIEYLNKSRMSVVLHSNFSLMSKKIINELAKRGLFSITSSFDSFGNFEKNNKTIFELLEHAKISGIVPILSSVVTSKNIGELIQVAEYTISKGILYNISLYQNIGGAFSPQKNELVPSKEDLKRFANDMNIIKHRTGGVRTTFGFLNPENIKYYYKKWKCDPNRDNWIIVNNDGKIMRCEEYPSNIDLLSLRDLEDVRWTEYKKKIKAECQGCYHHCYFDAERLRGIKILHEFKGIIKNIEFCFKSKETHGYANTNS